MRQLLKVTVTFIVMTGLTIFLFLFYFKDNKVLLQTIISLIVLVYINEMSINKVFNNIGYKTSLETRQIFNIFPVYDIKFLESVRILKSDYFFIIMLIPVVVLVLHYFMINPTFILQTIAYVKNQDYFGIIKVYYILFLVVIFEFRNIMYIIRGILKYTSFIIVISNGNEFIFQKVDNLKAHHRKIFMMENYDYKKYSLQDLIREKIYLEGKMEKRKKAGFYDTYILPILIVFFSSIVSFASNYYSNLLTRVASSYNAGIALKDFFVTTLQFSIPVFLISILFKMPSYRNIADLKTRLLVVEMMIKNK